MGPEYALCFLDRSVGCVCVCMCERGIFDVVCVCVCVCCVAGCVVGSLRSELLRQVITEEDEQETTDGSHDNHVTLNLGSLLQPKLIT